MNPIEQTATNLQAIHPEIPVEKVATMVARTFIGGLFLLVGLGLLVILVGLPAISGFRSGTVEIPLIRLAFGLGAGLGLIVLGATTWSSQLVARPIALTMAAFKGIWQTVRGTPTGGA